MGKVMPAILAATMLVAGAASPWRASVIRAQTAPAVSCAGAPPSAPMQGHYTGTWHSDGDYHFNVFNTDLDLKVVIDGTLDLTMTADGRLSGTAQGKVDAPITHNGQKDVSSGYGTISGQLQGVYAAGGPVVILTDPIIDMHWGTFVGGGYTVEEHIAMPQYQFPVTGIDCISSQGTISETNFPVMTVVADGLGQEVQAPGVGTASGSWQIASDAAARFQQLSGQVDAFLASADSLLRDSSRPLTPRAVEQQIVQPLQALEATIAADPDVARCLLERLGSWEASAVHTLELRAAAGAGAKELLPLRRAGDALREARLVNLDCPPAGASTAASLLATANAQVDTALARREWTRLALASRETLLLGGDAGRPALQLRVDTDVHRLLGQTSTVAGLRELSRIAFALGDDTDARGAWQQLAARLAAHVPTKAVRKEHGRKPVPAPSKPTPLRQALAAATPAMHVTISTGSGPSLSWRPIPGAASYLVTVIATKSPRLLWSWSGGGTTVSYGDSAIPGVSSSAGEAWPIALPAGSFTWTALALDGKGRIIAAAFRVRG
ncbi:MAG TPA: hypothetical protein VKX16_16980 [Chloroflexota bacterium]|nr:hypothetical protein [Chloroflexota bacterium]